MSATFQPRLAVYLLSMSVVLALMMEAGCSDGETLLGAESDRHSASSTPSRPVSDAEQRTLAGTGQQLFLRNCAHCHGADGRGDEGPDLHDLGWTDDQITARIRNGKKGQMTAFAGKLSSKDISEIIVYLRTLR